MAQSLYISIQCCHGNFDNRNSYHLADLSQLTGPTHGYLQLGYTGNSQESYSQLEDMSQLTGMSQCKSQEKYSQSDYDRVSQLIGFSFEQV